MLSSHETDDMGNLTLVSICLFLVGLDILNLGRESCLRLCVNLGAATRSSQSERALRPS